MTGFTGSVSPVMSLWRGALMPVLFLILWLLLNGKVTLEILLFGIGISLVLYLFLVFALGWSLRREALFWRALPCFLLYLLNLVRETAVAAATVARLALTPSKQPEPVLVEFHSGLETNWQNVLLANSITLTPGTITVFQEGDHFLIHSLRTEYAEGIEACSFIRLLRRFPT